MHMLQKNVETIESTPEIRNNSIAESSIKNRLITRLRYNVLSILSSIVG